MQKPIVELDLTGRVAVLTGGAGILGSRFALALLQQGAHVAIIDSTPGKAESLVDSLVKDGYQGAKAYSTDITQRDQLIDLQKNISMDLGEPSILVNSAAAKSVNYFEPFESYPLDDWNEVVEVNTTGVMLGCQVFGGRMAELGKGSIINLISIYGVVAPDQRIYEGSMYEGRAINTPAVYSTSKAAVWGLTRYLATYWADRGVRVNAITPGGVFSGQNDTFVKRYSQRVPMGRMADRDEMSGALIFLASSASSYITGQNIIVDGGLTVW